jgi:UDP-GlcNAc:undecaprenyl-phosphate/decaprenyl-phosphate GlcNAc-1-phosphate transferase
MSISVLSASFFASAAMSWLLKSNLPIFSFTKSNTTGERFASQSKPVYGGFIFLASIFSASISDYFFASGATAPVLALIPLALAFASGLVDDMFNTPPGFKFIAQIITGVLIFYLGLCPNFFSNYWLNLLFCVFWCVALMNSLNMLDNMDAVAASTALSVVAALMLSAFIYGSSSSFFVLSAPFAIGLAVFLVFNWHPSSLYMGDNGSQLLGAALAIVSLWHFAPVEQVAGITQLRAPAAMCIALAVPFADTLSVSINRLRKGKSPFVGDKYHTTHNLFYLGMKIPVVTLTLAAAALCCAAAGIVFSMGGSTFTVTDIICLLIAAIATAGLYIITIAGKQKLEQKTNI